MPSEEFKYEVDVIRDTQERVPSGCEAEDGFKGDRTGGVVRSDSGEGRQSELRREVSQGVSIFSAPSLSAFSLVWCLVL